MKSVTIPVEKRESLGKASTRSLRKANRVPCVVYNSRENIHFSTPLFSFKNLVYTSEAHTVIIEWPNGRQLPAILQDIQFHPVSDLILHADFYLIQDEKPVVMEIPIKIIGRSIGISQGGALCVILRKLKIQALLEDLPDKIEIDITSLDMGQNILVNDISIHNSEYIIQHPKDTIILSLKTARSAVKSAQISDIKAKDDKQEK